MDASQGRPWVQAGIVAALAMLCACSSDETKPVPTSAGDFSWARVQTEAVPELGTYHIELLTDAPLQLAVGEQAVVQVRLTDVEDAPVADLRVNFALVGQPRDAGLAALDATTNADGIAQNTLIAGENGATFALRISTPGAEDVQIEVAVSGDGFGSLLVSAPYGGRRPVTHRIVAAQPGTLCSAADWTTFVPSRLIAQDSDSALVDRLPAGLTYAVTAIAESDAQAIVARGCVDGIRVRAGRVTEVSVTFDDAAFQQVGQFSVKAELTATEPARTLANVLQEAAEAAITTDDDGDPVGANAEARFLLDSLDQALHAQPYATQTTTMQLAAALTDARADSGRTPSLELSLQQRLDGNSTGPLVAIPRIASMARTSLTSMTLFGALTLDPQNSKQPVVWQARRIQAEPTVRGGAPPMLDLAGLRLAADTSAHFLAGKDKLMLSSVSFRANLGELAVAVLERAVAAVGAGDSEHTDPLGCTVLGQWLGQQNSLQGHDACGSECLSDTCNVVMDRIQEAAHSALVALDDTRPNLRLGGTLDMHDDNGDLLADSLSSTMFSGEWLAARDGEPDALKGTLSATALTDRSQLP